MGKYNFFVFDFFYCEVVVKLIGVCGSQRPGSFNRMVLKIISNKLSPEDSLEILDWDSVPPFDVERLGEKTPQEVLNVAAILKDADAVIISSPEYNYSIPGMLKNLIDWMSKIDSKPFNGKPIAIISATTGQLGGSRMQYDLRKILLCLNASVLSKPEVFISRVKDKINDDGGGCLDLETLNAVLLQVEALRKLRN